MKQITETELNQVLDEVDAQLGMAEQLMSNPRIEKTLTRYIALITENPVMKKYLETQEDQIAAKVVRALQSKDENKSHPISAPKFSELITD